MMQLKFVTSHKTNYSEGNIGRQTVYLLKYLPKKEWRSKQQSVSFALPTQANKQRNAGFVPKGKCLLYHSGRLYALLAAPSGKRLRENSHSNMSRQFGAGGIKQEGTESPILTRKK